MPLIAELVRRAGSRIVVMPGGGIGPGNIGRIVAAAKPKEIHFTAPEPAASGMEYRRSFVFMGGELRPPEYDRITTSTASVRSVMAAAG
jgi:copper homeostasis protein